MRYVYQIIQLSGWVPLGTSHYATRGDVIAVTRSHASAHYRGRGYNDRTVARVRVSDEEYDVLAQDWTAAMVAVPRVWAPRTYPVPR